MKMSGGASHGTRTSKKLAIVVIGAFLYAAGLNLFLIPANVYASGFTGVAQPLSSVVDQYAPFIFRQEFSCSS